MNNSIKNLRKILIFGLIEFLAFKWYVPQNMEVFYMFWAFIALSLFLYMWFNLPSTHDYYRTPWSVRGVKTFVHSSGHTAYFFYFLINVIGYISVM